LTGLLTYLEEFGFVFEPAAPVDLQLLAGGAGVASLSLGTLQIAIGVETGYLLYPWGYFPHMNWVESSLHPPDSDRSVLRAEADEDRPFARGVSFDLPCDGEWIAEYDPHTGWLRISDNGHHDKSRSHPVEFATSSIASVSEGRIRELWLQPEWERRTLRSLQAIGS
jgi:hypothetical protein